MANELQITGAIKYAKGYISQVTRSYSNQNVTITGNEYVAKVQTIGSGAAEALILTDDTPGFFIGHNLSTDTTVSIRAGLSEVDVVEIRAGEWSGPWRLATATPYAIASSGTAQLEYWIIPD